MTPALHPLLLLSTFVKEPGFQSVGSVAITNVLTKCSELLEAALKAPTFDADALMTSTFFKQIPLSYKTWEIRLITHVALKILLLSYAGNLACTTFDQVVENMASRLEGDSQDEFLERMERAKVFFQIYFLQSAQSDFKLIRAVISLFLDVNDEALTDLKELTYEGKVNLLTILSDLFPTSNSYHTDSTLKLFCAEPPEEWYAHKEDWLADLKRGITYDHFLR